MFLSLLCPGRGCGCLFAKGFLGSGLVLLGLLLLLGSGFVCLGLLQKLAMNLVGLGRSSWGFGGSDARCDALAIDLVRGPLASKLCLL